MDKLVHFNSLRIILPLKIALKECIINTNRTQGPNKIKPANKSHQDQILERTVNYLFLWLLALLIKLNQP